MWTWSFLPLTWSKSVVIRIESRVRGPLKLSYVKNVILTYLLMCLLAVKGQWIDVVINLATVMVWSHCKYKTLVT